MIEQNKFSIENIKFWSVLLDHYKNKNKIKTQDLVPFLKSWPRKETPNLFYLGL